MQAAITEPVTMKTVTATSTYASDTRLCPSEATNRMPSSGETRPAIQAGTNIASQRDDRPENAGE